MDRRVKLLARLQFLIICAHWDLYGGRPQDKQYKTSFCTNLEQTCNQKSIQIFRYETSTEQTCSKWSLKKEGRLTSLLNRLWKPLFNACFCSFSLPLDESCDVLSVSLRVTSSTSFHDMVCPLKQSCWHCWGMSEHITERCIWYATHWTLFTPL